MYFIISLANQGRVLGGSDPGFLARWVVAVTLGRLVGFGIVFAGGWGAAYAATEGMDDETRVPILFVMAVVLGCLDGMVMGWIQWRVLRSALPDVTRAIWVRNTAIASTLVWASAMLMPSVYARYGVLNDYQEIAIWVPACLVMFIAVGAGQARALKGIVRNPNRWTTANVMAWLPGLPIAFVIALRPVSEDDLLAFGFGYVVVGLLTAPFLGVLTGQSLIRFRSPRVARGGR